MEFSFGLFIHSIRTYLHIHKGGFSSSVKQKHQMTVCLLLLGREIRGQSEAVMSNACTQTWQEGIMIHFYPLVR